jgi:hypothetical protein
LLAAEIAELRPEWSILVEDLDPYRHLTERWPGETLSLRLVAEGEGRGTVRLIDTGPGDTPAFIQALERADYVQVATDQRNRTLVGDEGFFVPSP